MINKSMKLKDIKIDNLPNLKNISFEEISTQDVAIIGISGKFASCDNMNEFYISLRNGDNLIGKFPQSRKQDTGTILRYMGITEKEASYYDGAFLNEIDKFDCSLFNISPKEAGLMDPNQRLFLQTAWNAIEDSGYGGDRLRSSRTGVYVGYCGDFNEDYRKYVQLMDPSMASLSVTGNIKSIVASRISYLLDLKGPSMLVDTACSSTLVAIHLACQALRKGECETAIAGGVKLILLPVDNNPQNGIGIESSSGVTRSFDEYSDGTGFGEGVAAIVLKPLKKAIEDRDNIYSIIKGSAVNQDGTSMGITAPNAQAQSDVIIRAWKDAKIDPETISYIEAHGTGTNLGDPVEIDGIEMAFAQYTNKKQFCAVSSVKTNIGHLDSAAGIAGLLKAVLSLKHKELFPSLHFDRPNQKINFENSPVYINDSLEKWENHGGPRRCGISSFGLSGTNCHLVLEEPPRIKSIPEESPGCSYHIFTLSSQNINGLMEQLGNYEKYLNREGEVSLGSLCSTANTGRGHYNFRLAFVITSINELTEKIQKLTWGGLENPEKYGVYFGKHKIVDKEKESRGNNEYSQEDISDMSLQTETYLNEALNSEGQQKKVSLLNICALYVNGANVQWNRLYKSGTYAKVSLPGYSFMKKRCWIEQDSSNSQNSKHPLIDKHILESVDLDVFSTTFKVDRQWVLNEHQIGSNYVAPGTTYLEMIREASRKHFENHPVKMQQVTFIHPLILKPDEEKEVHTIIKRDEDTLEYTIASKQKENGQWLKHSTGVVAGIFKEDASSRSLDFEKIKEACPNVIDIGNMGSREGILRLGPRWDTLKAMYTGDGMALACFELGEEYSEDLSKYHMYPSLMDCAVNIANMSVGEGLYLPLSYESLKIYETLPRCFYSHLVRKDNMSLNNEIAIFNITLMDEYGKVLAEIEDYSVKKVHNTGLEAEEPENLFYKTGWEIQEQEFFTGENFGFTGVTIIFNDEYGMGEELAQKLRAAGTETVEVEFGSDFRQIYHGKYMTGTQEGDFRKLFSELKGRTVNRIIYLSALNFDTHMDIDGLDEAMERGVYNLHRLTRVISESIQNDLDLVIIADNASQVVETQEKINAFSGSVYAMGRVIGQEYDNIRCRCIDIDKAVDIDLIISELAQKKFLFNVSYRNGKRYIQNLQRQTPYSNGEDKIQIREQGVYIVAGGLGGIGLEICRYLAAEKRVNLVLINRSPLPERSLWDDILKNTHDGINGTDHNIIDRIKSIKELEDMGSKVVCFSADLSDMASVRQIFDEVRKHYASINGVINLSGVFEEGILIKKDTEAIKRVIAPKVNGTLILDRLTEHDKLDFFVMFSSIASFIGGHGQGEYSAANAFMDSFAEYKNRTGRKVISINWTGWNQVGMASQYNLSDGRRIFKLISKEKAIKAFDRALTAGLPRVVIGELDYEFMAEYAMDNAYIQLSQEIKNSLRPYIKLSQQVQQPEKRNIVLPKGRQNQKYTSMEKSIATVWGEVLGLDEIDIYENLYNLGGDSIIALRIANEINKKLNASIRISDLFEYLTVQRLAEFLEDKALEKEVFVKDVREPEPEHTFYELSNIQKRIWFLQNYDPQMTVYNLPLVSYINTELNVHVLKEAVNLLIQRHEVLRAVFGEENGEPYQRILTVYEYEPEVVDLTGEPHKESVLNELIAQENKKPFNLSKPPMRVIVYKLSNSSYCLYLNIHHIVTDGWSMGIFSYELMKLYEGIILGKVVELEPLNFRYTGWVKQQLEWQDSPEFVEMENYWMQELCKPLPVLNLPVDYKRPQMQTYNGSFIKFSIDENTTAKLKEFARKHNITLNMALLSAYFVLLKKITADKDIIVGLPVTGRENKELENIMGVFINTLSIRVNFENISSLDDLITCVREKCLKAYRNIKYPFDLIISKLNPERDLSRSPVFSTVFQLYDKIPPETEGSSMFELSMLCREEDNRIEIRAEYNTDLFEKQTIESFAVYYKNIINAILIESDTSIDGIEILSLEEKNRIITLFNATEREYDRTATIDTLFEFQAKASPHSQCIIQGNTIYTYAQINSLANCIAGTLLEKGVMKGDIVGIMVERSCNMLVGILGILKAGAAYLPIDPEYPGERINYMLNDSSVKVLLTSGRLKGTVDYYGISVDLDDDGLYTRDCENLSINNSPDSLAYVIYTSGSTGKPKGVMIEHQAVCNFIESMVEKIEFSSGKSILALTSMSFDIFVLETILPLCIGMKVVIASEEQQKDPKLLSQIIKENSIEMLQMTPSRLQLLLSDSRGRSSLSVPQVLMVGGEAFPQALLEEVKRCTNARIYNMYGPTETTIWSTIRELTDRSTIDIGKPIANTQVYIVSESGNLQPVGIPGELCISGDGLSRGYINRPELTLEKFVENPYMPGKKMYRTGDLVKWLPDGNIEYIRRIDHQIKLRGYRIELGEIEELLLKYSGVREAVVDVKGEDSESRYLGAYVTADRGLTEAELKKYLENELPQYMIPAYIMVLEELPLTPNGKTDRKALPCPVLTDLNTNSFVDAVSETEKALQRIYREVLNIQRAGVNDNFFALGGHSLKATILVSRIYKELGAEIPLSAVFKTPTIKELAGYINGTDISEYQPIIQVEKSSSYSLSPAQRRIYLMEAVTGESTAYNIPVVMDLEGEFDRERFEQAIKKLVERHEILRTYFDATDGVPVQIVRECMEPEIAYIETKEDDSDGKIQNLIKPFNLKSGPLFRVNLLLIDNGKKTIMFDIHHIICDGMSLGILTRDFIELYRGKELEELTVQYRDYVSWKSSLYGSERYKQQENYWIGMFSGDIPVLNMPADYTRPTVQSYEGDTVYFELNEAVSKKLHEVETSEKTTTSMTLLAVFNVLLYKYTGQEDIIVGMPVAGRGNADLENMLGVFINTLAMRNRPEGTKTFRNFLQEVRHNALNAYENQDYQFEELVDKLNVPRDLSRSPLFDVMFIMQNTSLPEIEEEGLRFKSREFDSKSSKFDLTLESVEKENTLHFRLEYCTKIFMRETVERMSLHFLNILEQVLNNPDITLSDIDIITKEEKEKIEGVFNATDVDFGDSGKLTVHELFERQAEFRPDSIAVMCEGTGITYNELNEKANKLARLLQNEGIKREEPVGIMVHKSIEMIIGMLGILKAGGAYVPVDPDYPADRIHYMLKHSQTRFLIIDQSSFEKTEMINTEENSLEVVINLSEGAGKAAGLIKYTAEDIKNLSPYNLTNKTNPENLMYIIYTSGSTGLPKGVGVSHANAVNYLNWSIENINLSPKDVMALVTSMSFDISVFEIFGSLLSGACLCIVPDSRMKDGSLFMEYIDAGKVTIWHSVPALMIQLLTAVKSRKTLGNQELFSRIRCIMIGGEAWTYELAKDIRGYFHHARLVNMYGPTEATIWVTSYDVGDNPGNSTVIPIGKPISNNKVLILDACKKMCPIGIPGDIYISGLNVTRGYYKDEEKTREVFTPYGEKGSIIYRTGDVGKYLSDGTIEYLGRKDGMIKVRGYRIEIGEIENVLLQNEEIIQVAVVAKKSGETSKLICYYTAPREHTYEELRACLEKKLPDYMIPAQFIWLEKMILTPNGKIDRKSLTALDIGEPFQRNENYAMPESEVERFLAGIWSQLLDMKKVGTKDNFFSLGGNSLLVNQMHSMIDEKYPGKIKVIDIFKYPTISKLADFMEDSEQKKHENITVSTSDDGDDDIIKLLDGFESGDILIDEVLSKLDDM